MISLSPAMDDPVPAAQYLRMSTEHQRYSLEGQAAAIAAWAAARGYSIAATYADPGRSGLTLDGRPGLKQLLADVLRPDRPFRAVLVLDVSRWGRFQDPDQAAHYEFICRSAGVPVHYCAEPFDNDGALASVIIKHLKRVMAGEYSRELSERVVRAQLRQARQGFKQGGGRAYGVRRVLVDEGGRVRLELQDGQRKAVSAQRVVLVRGPAQECDTIRRIFELYARKRWTMEAIAQRLNAEGVPSNQGRPWTYARVRCVLTSETALGYYVFNRCSRRMKARQTVNPPQDWVRVKVMAPVVSRALFEAAARRIAAGRPRLFGDADMLRRLARLYRERGHLTTYIVDACPYTPASATYRQRFGGVQQAYAQVGFRRRNRWGAHGGRPASDAELLALLRELHGRYGHVSSRVLRAERGAPSPELYRDRFGSLLEAYRQAGLPHTKAELLSGGHRRAMANLAGPSGREAEDNGPRRD